MRIPRHLSHLPHAALHTPSMRAHAHGALQIPLTPRFAAWASPRKSASEVNCAGLARAIRSRPLWSHTGAAPALRHRVLPSRPCVARGGRWRIHRRCKSWLDLWRKCRKPCTRQIARNGLGALRVMGWRVFPAGPRRRGLEDGTQGGCSRVQKSCSRQQR